MPSWLTVGLIASVIIIGGAHLLGIPIWVITLAIWIFVFGIIASVRKQSRT